jgi:Regulator of ribonuclease activity B
VQRGGLVLTVALLTTLLNFFGCARKPDLDESVLIQLKKAGSDLSKPHNIEFFLYFPTRAAAEQAASKIRDEGFQVKVQKAAKGDDWLCSATKTMVPELLALQRIRQNFGSLESHLTANMTDGELPSRNRRPAGRACEPQLPYEVCPRLLTVHYTVHYFFRAKARSRAAPAAIPATANAVRFIDL